MAAESRSKDELRAAYDKYTNVIFEQPYDIRHWLNRARFFEAADYPDLAVGDFYKALLLVDDASDPSGEYHEPALEAYFDLTTLETIKDDDGELIEETAQAIGREALQCYRGLAQNLALIGSLYDAHHFCQLGLRTSPHDLELKDVTERIIALSRGEEVKDGGDVDIDIDTTLLPKHTTSRREIYPWNYHEPDRYTGGALDFLNERLQHVTDNCVVRVVELPILSRDVSVSREGSSPDDRTVKQLGLFAKENIAPGTTILSERSLLAVNNRLHDELCDACSAELPRDTSQSFACEDCMTTVFCSQSCLEQALTSYHAASCGNEDFEAINKDVENAEATNALYSLLLGRAICMSETQDTHPLNLAETRFLWGDYSAWEPPSKPQEAAPEAAVQRPRTLPWSFEQNISGPIHLLTTLDIDIFRATEKYDFWILNTLFAKFRGVANARMDPRTGKPEVAAVHPLWCLANHSCAPNVRWEWGGEIKMWTRDGSKDEVVRWGKAKDDDSNDRWRGGVKAGSEILNHYCDVRLPVTERREWAAGALGGDCRCERCLWEAGESTR